MASPFAKYEGATLRKVLAVALEADGVDAGASPAPVLHLAALVEVSGGGRSWLRGGFVLSLLFAGLPCSVVHLLATQLDVALWHRADAGRGGLFSRVRDPSCRSCVPRAAAPAAGRCC